MHLGISVVQLLNGRISKVRLGCKGLKHRVSKSSTLCCNVYVDQNFYVSILAGGLASHDPHFKIIPFQFILVFMDFETRCISFFKNLEKQHLQQSQNMYFYF